MTLNTRIKQLEAEQEAAAARPVVCICQLVFVVGEPTPAQAAAIARNATCRADHTDNGFAVVETPPVPDWMQHGTPRPVRELAE